MGGYGAWLIIPLVVGSDLTPSIKTALTAVLGATPLLTKLLAIALLGRPTIDFLKRHSFKSSQFAAHRLAMSALGQKPTIFTAPFYDCLAPESGHLSAWARKDWTRLRCSPISRSASAAALPPLVLCPRKRTSQCLGRQELF